MDANTPSTWCAAVPVASTRLRLICARATYCASIPYWPLPDARLSVMLEPGVPAGITSHCHKRTPADMLSRASIRSSRACGASVMRRPSTRAARRARLRTTSLLRCVSASAMSLTLPSTVAVFRSVGTPAKGAMRYRRWAAVSWKNSPGASSIQCLSCKTKPSPVSSAQSVELSRFI